MREEALSEQLQGFSNSPCLSDYDGKQWIAWKDYLGFDGSRIGFTGISWCPQAGHFTSQSLIVLVCNTVGLDQIFGKHGP